MVKVLQVVHTMECGGIETMLMNIYRRIDRKKIQFDFLVNGTKDNYYTKEIESLGGRVLNITPKRISLRRNISEMIQIMREGRYDVVHIHQDSMIGIDMYCAKKAGVQTIFTHAHTTSANGWHRKILAILSRKYICKNATLKLACSNAASKWIYGKKPGEVKIFQNAIDAELFRDDKKIYENNRKKIGIDVGKFVIGTCGRFSVEKNQIFLIDVFAEIKKANKDAVLILIGDGDEKEKIIDRAKSLGVYENIIFTGMVDNVEFYYKILDCFVLPSLFEGLPLAGVEAQAAGVSCFFSTGVTKELKITDNVQFLSLDLGAKGWAEKILSADCRRSDTYEKIKKAGYDIGMNVKKLQEQYLLRGVD